MTTTQNGEIGSCTKQETPRAIDRFFFDHRAALPAASQRRAAVLHSDTRKSMQAHAGSQKTPHWRELDSNHRSAKRHCYWSGEQHERRSNCKRRSQYRKQGARRHEQAQHEKKNDLTEPGKGIGRLIDDLSGTMTVTAQD
jgi:hypothetical protein